MLEILHRLIADRKKLIRKQLDRDSFFFLTDVVATKHTMTCLKNSSLDLILSFFQQYEQRKKKSEKIDDVVMLLLRNWSELFFNYFLQFAFLCKSFVLHLWPG